MINQYLDATVTYCICTEYFTVVTMASCTYLKYVKTLSYKYINTAVVNYYFNLMYIKVRMKVEKANQVNLLFRN